MSSPDIPLAPTETALFLGNEHASFYGKLMAIGGVVLIAGGILVGIVVILLPPEFAPGATPLIWMTTPPILAGLTLVSAGVSQWRAPQQVDVDASGVTIHSGLGRKQIAWSEVTALQTGQKSSAMGHTTLKTVRLLGSGGRVLAELNSHLQPFDELVVKLWEFGSIGRDLEVTDTAHRKRRREAWLLVLLGPAFTALGIWGTNESSRELRQRNELAQRGIETMALVQQHYMFNVTPRLEYVFDDDSGVKHHRNTIVARDTWNRLKAGDQVSIRYLADDPEYSRLVQGDLDDQESHDPQLMLVAGPFCALMGLLFLCVGVLQFCGVDVDRWLNSKVRKK